MANREEHAIAPPGSPQAGNGDQTTATSLEDALIASEVPDAAQNGTTVDELEEALSASLEILKNSIDQDDAVNTNTMGESDHFTAPLDDQRLSHAVPTASIDALSLDHSSGFIQYNTFDGTSEGNIAQNTSGPVQTPEVDTMKQPTSEPLSKLSGDAHSIAVNLESIYQTTASPEMKQIIACLVHLDTAITRQTHLNNLHEAHTAKNFREQRHVNKDRKLRLLETIQNVNRKFARVGAERMETGKLAKQCEIRVNSHDVQLKDIKDRVKMCAEGGEWMEAELAKVTERFEQENKELKKQNKYLKSKVRGLEEEIDVLRGRDGVWERRVTALEEYIKSKVESDWIEVSIDKETVFDAVRFSVGNYRVSSIFH
ncbi:hypothetical protein KCU95_g2325, partial [Aureobasidium melanogenum]